MNEDKSMWQKIKEHAEAYAQTSTIHGFFYLGEPDRNWRGK